MSLPFDDVDLRAARGLRDRLGARRCRRGPQLAREAVGLHCPCVRCAAFVAAKSLADLLASEIPNRSQIAESLPGVGTLWHSKADRDGEHGLFLVRHVGELVVGRDSRVDLLVRLERDDGAVFDVTPAVLFADFAPCGAGAPAQRRAAP